MAEAVVGEPKPIEAKIDIKTSPAGQEYSSELIKALEQTLPGWSYIPIRGHSFTKTVSGETWRLNLGAEILLDSPSSASTLQSFLLLLRPHRAEFKNGEVVFYSNEGRYKISNQGRTHAVYPKDGGANLAKLEIKP